MALFVYGTLRDRGVRQTLLGAAAPRKTVAARATGWRTVAVAGVDYPVLAQSPSTIAIGELLLDLSPRAMAILDAYEGDEYVRTHISVESMSPSGEFAGSQDVQTYLPTPDLLRRAGPLFREWSYDVWRRSAGARRRGAQMF